MAQVLRGVPLKALAPETEQPDTLSVPLDQLSVPLEDLTPEPAANFSTTNEKDAEGNAVVSAASKAFDWMTHSALQEHIASAFKAIADKMDAPRLPESDTAPSSLDALSVLGGPIATLAKQAVQSPTMRGMAAGVTQGVGEMASSFATPAGALMLLADLGPEAAIIKKVPALKALAELPQVQKLQRAIQAAAGGTFATHGAARMVSPDSTMTERLQGLAEAAGGAAGVASAASRGASVPQAARPPRMTAEEQASNALADARGVPLDAATRTGSKFVRGVQKVAGESLLGSAAGERGALAQQQALQRVAQQLADETGVSRSVTPEQAGEAAQAAATDIGARTADAYAKTAEKLRQAVRPGEAVTAERAGSEARGAQRGAATEQMKMADEAYSLVRDIEKDSPETIQLAPRGSARERQILNKLASESTPDTVDPNTGDVLTWKKGKPPTERELMAMRQIEAELEAMPYSDGGLVNANQLTELEAKQGDQYVRAAGGHPVFHDITAKMTRTTDPTRADVLQGLRETLETGEWTTAGRAAYQVAQDRLRASGSLSPQPLPPGRPLLGPTKTINAPVDVRPFQAAMKPIYEQLSRERELMGTLMGDRGRMLVALDKLMQAPAYESLSVVDSVLGDLKRFSRVENVAERTEGQGIAAEAVTQLEKAVTAKAEQIGAMPALREGRKATIEKWSANDAADKLRESDVQAFRQLVSADDVNIAQLQDVAKRTPTVVPQLARALVDDVFDAGMVDGSFSLDAAPKMAAAWAKYGDATKRLLIPNAMVRQRLDAFFSHALKAKNAPFLTIKGSEGVKVFKQLAAEGDANVGTLRALNQVSPDASKMLGRAWLQDAFGLATERGRFDHADRLWAKWQKLGSETKRLYYPDAEHRKAIGDFMLLAKRISENPNPSGTAPTLLKTGELTALLTHPLDALPVSFGMGGLSKLLYSPEGAKAVARFLERSNAVRSAPPPIRVVRQRAAWAELLASARSAGVRPVPGAAQDDSERPPAPTR